MSSNDPIQQVIDQVQSPAGDFPLEVAIPGTPQVFRGKTPQEVLNQLVQAQQNATQAIATARAEAQQARQEAETLRGQIPPPPPLNAPDAEKEAYYKQWATDPDKAFDAQLAKRLNIDPERVPEVLRRVVEGGTANSAADEFMARCPDFPQGPQTAALINGALRQRFGSGVDAVTADNLELVYHDLVRSGQIQPNVMPIAGQIQQNNVMPNLRGGGAPQNQANDIMAQARNMPIDKLKEVIDRLASQARR